jgi:hypothetical protein
MRFHQFDVAIPKLGLARPHFDRVTVDPNFVRQCRDFERVCAPEYEIRDLSHGNAAPGRA